MALFKPPFTGANKKEMKQQISSKNKNIRLASNEGKVFLRDVLHIQIKMEQFVQIV